MLKPFLTAHWRYLAMLNFRVAPEILAPYLPAGTELDFFRGETHRRALLRLHAAAALIARANTASNIPAGRSGLPPHTRSGLTSLLLTATNFSLRLPPHQLPPSLPTAAKKVPPASAMRSTWRKSLSFPLSTLNFQL